MLLLSKRYTPTHFDSSFFKCRMAVEKTEKADPITYTVKTILFMKRRVPIMMQNQNGPCPLLALANILLLRNQIQLSPDAPSISQARPVT